MHQVSVQRSAPESEQSTPEAESLRKARAAAMMLDERRKRSDAQMDKLDLKEAHARCFQGGNHGTIQVGG